MKDTKILVVTHKAFDSSIIPDCYQVICVGNNSLIESDNLHYITDNTGDNIAAENPYYCELTAQYWGWKNLSDDIKYIGISHYRRYFFSYKHNSKSFKEDIIDEKRIKDILAKHKVIMSFPTIKYPGYGSLYKKMEPGKQDLHWIIIQEIIKSDYKEFEEEFNKIMYGHITTWGNMLITTREIYNEYCAWIFEILNKYDNEIRNRGLNRIPRVDGFLSEYLLLVWMHHRFKKNEIYYLEVRNTETDSFSEYGDGLSNRIIRFIRCNRPLLVLARYSRMFFLFFKRFDINRIAFLRGDMSNER